MNDAFFQAMANETRREIIRLLKQKDMTRRRNCLTFFHFQAIDFPASGYAEKRGADCTGTERKSDSLRHQHDGVAGNGSGVSVSGAEEGGILS